jgi:hypothetical protein
MKTFLALAALGSLAVSTAAAAHDTTVAYASRGQCESASAAQSNAEKAWVLATFPDLFDSTGDVASFLTRAWTCDVNSTDGQYYIVNHIDEVLGSRWYEQRNH